MNNILSYKDYIGSVEWSEEDGCYCGEVLGLPNGTMILYEGNDVDELEKDFHDAIDHYLATCKERNLQPQKSRMPTFNAIHYSELVAVP